MDSQILNKLRTLSPEQQQSILPLFGSIERFYATVYEIVHTGHETELQKPDHLEQRLEVIRTLKQKVINRLSAAGLPGQDIWDDIASDYFEDYVAYRESSIPPLNHAEFLGIVKRLLAEPEV